MYVEEQATNTQSIRRSFFAYLLATLPVAAAAPESPRPRLDRLEHLKTRDGLSHRWVRDLYQDRQGFLWIATGDGLNRYDGRDFKVYHHDPDDPESLSDDHVTHVVEDRAGRLWVGTEHGLNLLLRDEDRFVRYHHDGDDPASDYVMELVEDHTGALWIATLEGVNRRDPASGEIRRFLHDPADPDSLSTIAVVALLETRDQTLWLGGEGGLLNTFDGDGFTHHAVLPNGPLPGGILSLAEDPTGRLWVGTLDAGLILFDPETGLGEHYPVASGDVRDPRVSSFTWGQNGLLWIGTQSNGVQIFDSAEGTFSVHRHDADVPGTLSGNRVLTVLEDRMGVVWFGTDNGLDKYVPARERFALYRHWTGDPTSLSGTAVWPILEDREGTLWVGTAEQGLNALDREAGTNTVYRHDPADRHSLPSDRLTCLFEDSQGVLWVAAEGGLSRFDRAGGRFDRVVSPSTATPQNWIYGLAEDAEADLWVAGTGLWHLDRETFEYERRLPEDDADLDFIYGFHRDAATGALSPGGDQGGETLSPGGDQGGETLWLALGHLGLVRFDPARDEVVSYRHDPDDPTSLGTDSVSAVYRARSGDLWVGTQGAGLARLDEETGAFRHYREKDGLVNGHILSIEEDTRGHLWMATNQGLVRFDPRGEGFRSYNGDDGLEDNAFYIASSGHDARGMLFFGGTGGMSAFYPSRIDVDPHAPPVAITGFRLFNELTPLAERLDAGSRDGERAEPRLVLGYRDHVFALEFAALHFANPGKNRYAYRLEGFDEDWVSTNAGHRFAHYSNLDAGDYTFRVKASNQDGVWNEEGTAIHVTVKPPPWKTWWAYTCYALALLFAGWSYVRAQQRKIEYERSVNERLRQVDKLKDEFLANTSHELRTPLYGIVGITESLIDGATGDLPADTRSNLAMIASSGRRLSKLVEDILDFSKLSRERLELHKKPVDLRALADVVLHLSVPLVGSKKLRLLNSVDPHMDLIEADENRLQQILYNLIGNAIKFTDQGVVDVTAVDEGDRVIVAVSDTGIGIPEDKHEVIFGSFEQLDASAQRVYSGTGLGLALTRELIQLHGGHIRVESRPGHGATFLFTLPRSESLSTEGPAPSSRTGSSRSTEVRVFSSDDTGPVQPFLADEPEAGTDQCILVVDDEPVNRQVLINHLAAAGYDIVEASGGAEALEHFDGERTCDLILLDIMMPRMSGFEVCREVRKTHPVHELPVIFLTAKNQTEDRVAGFSSGANDYLIKPVAKDELLARVRTHLAIVHVNRQLGETVAARTAQVETLSGLLPICSFCKKIRDDQGYWNEVESYLDRRSEISFSHSLCPDCVRVHYPSIDAD